MSIKYIPIVKLCWGHSLQSCFNSYLASYLPVLSCYHTRSEEEMAVEFWASRYCVIITPPSWLDHLLAVLGDKTTGTVYCSSQIQFTVDQPLTCLPTSVSSDGYFVVPSGSVCAPSFVQNTVIQDFITINININEIIINVINISNNTIISKPPTVSLWPWSFTLSQTGTVSRCLAVCSCY